VVATPRIAAGSTVGSDWLRLLRCTEDKTQHDDLKKSCDQLLTLEVIATLGIRRGWKREPSGRWRQSAAAPCSARTSSQDTG
jgi:hypothetical protein